MDTIKFFSFGCWNLRGCIGNEHLQKNVDNIKSNDYQFGIILGDNIYVPKDQEPRTSSLAEGKPKASQEPRSGPKKKKAYDIQTLAGGMQCINDIQRPLHIVLGNHDVEQCNILLYQLYKHADEILPVDLSNWNIPSNYYTTTEKKDGVTVKIIVIDTNILDKPQVNYDPEECPVQTNVNGDVDQMLEMLEHELHSSDNVDWIIVAGHVPLASIKEKGSKIVQHIPQEYYIRIYEAIYTSPHRSKVLYICADTHNFQHNTLGYKEYILNEIVIGTGGATPDVINNVAVGTQVSIFEGSEALPREYTLTMNEYYPPYGYAEFVASKDKMDVAYVTAVVLKQN